MLSCHHAQCRYANSHGATSYNCKKIYITGDRGRTVSLENKNKIRKMGERQIGFEKFAKKEFN
jgi:hypothetical protein